jgi:hypothetical protein
MQEEHTASKAACSGADSHIVMSIVEGGVGTEVYFLEDMMFQIFCRNPACNDEAEPNDLLRRRQRRLIEHLSCFAVVVVSVIAIVIDNISDLAW